jgi:hypothetical protein
MEMTLGIKGGQSTPAALYALCDDPATPLSLVAARIHSRAAAVIGERRFAHDMLTFERWIGGRDETAWSILSSTDMRQVAFSYAICWLAHRGHGSVTWEQVLDLRSRTAQLNAALARQDVVSMAATLWR